MPTPIDITFGIVERLSEADKAEFDALDKTPSPEDLRKELNKPATVGWVKRYVHTHATWCPAQRTLKRIGYASLVLLGVVLTLTIVREYTLKRYLQDVIHEVLVREHLLSTQPVPPATTTRHAEDIVGMRR